MKYVFFPLLALLAMLTLSACASGPAGNDSAGKAAASPEDLLHRRFTLLSLDGKDFSARENPPVLEFNEGLRLSGAMCNRFTGPAELNGNILLAPNLVSTKMFCLDADLNAAEAAFFQALGAGAELELGEAQLILRGNGHEFVFNRGDWL